MSELFDVINTEFLWDTYLQTDAYHEKSFEDYQEEIQQKSRMKNMTKRELEEQAQDVENYIDNFFKRGGKQ